MKKDYDIEDAFAAIEDELISSMMRNMKRHMVEEVAEDKQWEMWQALQLKSLEEYKKKNQGKFTSWFSDINGQIDEVIKQANQTGQMEQELEILKAIKKGFKGARKASSTMQAEFFRLNERKLDALIKATKNDLLKAEHAILRRADDQYRKAIFNAQVYANSGAGTYEKAVDMATKDMLSAGLNCVEYANGARHTLKDYADMAIRTASKRAYLQGEGVMRQSWGISTVIINKRGNPCPKCLPFVGKVLIDDVWSGGKASDGPYPLMSSAIEAGLYHPRCKDSHTTYFEGISTPPDDKYTKGEIQQIEEDYREEQKKQYAKRQFEKYKRLEEHSLDEGNQRKYTVRSEEWEQIALKLEDTTDEWAEALRKELYLDEKTLASRTKETAVIYDSNGKYLFTKRGSEKSVEFTLSEILKMRNGIVTHNHPSGASFSVVDWELFRGAGLQELRVVGENEVYYLRRKNKSKIGATKDEFENEIKRIRKKVRSKYHKMYKDGIINKKERLLLSSDECNKKIAERFGLEYGKESLNE